MTSFNISDMLLIKEMEGRGVAKSPVMPQPGLAFLGTTFDGKPLSIILSPSACLAIVTAATAYSAVLAQPDRAPDGDRPS